jgi:ATP-dependent DNA helicase RecG
MDDRGIEALYTDRESDRVERKASFSDPDKVRQAVCAFANDLPGHGAPGVVFIGVHEDGSCAKIQVTDELLRNLAAMRDDGNIQPFPSIKVAKKTIHGCEIALVEVLPSMAPPVRYRGRVWIRAGPRRALATPDEELRLSERRRARDLPFDLQPLPSATLTDLDLGLFEREYLPLAVPTEFLATNDRAPTERLKALRFLTPDGLPTVLGLLVVGKDPPAFVPGAYIQFLRIDGTELTDAIRDQKEVEGPLGQLVRRIEEVLDAHNSVETGVTSGPVEVRRPQYPLPALQQLMRNAILHRIYEGTNAPVRVYWFSDRIEIQSPGGPFGQVTTDNFGEAGVTDYRNPHLAEAMKVLGYVQRFGIGIQIARRELQNNGNPGPEFHVEPSHVLVILRRGK